jgi:two-component system cell cycle sensor histidine kinase/response regulator CckA
MSLTAGTDRPLRVLLVEDSEHDIESLKHELRQGGYEAEISCVQTADAMEAALQNGAYDVVVSDFNLPRFAGPDALRILQASGRDLPFIVVSTQVGEDRAIEMMRAGAHDFVMKEKLGRLVPVIERELREATHRLERRRLEDQLRQAQKMEAVGRLAGGIAHDFNNLLMAVTGYSEMVLERMSGEDPLRKNVEEIRNAGTRAAALTRQLLTFSRKHVVLPAVLDANVVVTDLERMLRRLIGEDIELTTSVARVPTPVYADRGQLEQVLMNLVVNARDAMPNGGRLHIETSRVAVHASDKARFPGVTAGEYVSIEVRDTGIGMAPELVARIFEPFFTTKDAAKGTGLGLSTVYGIVKQADGVVLVDSTPGEGTVFRVLLPQSAEVPSRAGERVDPSDLPRGTETVLLVEDEAGVRELIRDCLTRWGYVVLAAQDAKQALELFSQHGNQVDLLVTDVVMPRLSGRVLAERLVGLQPSLRVLYMSGYTDDEAVGQSVTSGAGYLQKPFTPEALLRKARGILDGGPTVAF